MLYLSPSGSGEVRLRQPGVPDDVRTGVPRVALGEWYEVAFVVDVTGLSAVVAGPAINNTSETFAEPGAYTTVAAAWGGVIYGEAAIRFDDMICF